MRRFAAMLALIILFGSSLVSFEPGRAEGFVARLDTFQTGNAEQARDVWMLLAETDNAAARHNLAQAAVPEAAAALNDELKAELADAEAARRALQRALTNANEMWQAYAEIAESSVAEAASLREELAAARQELAQLKTALAEAQAGLQTAKASLTKTALRAPETKIPIEGSADVPGLANLPSAPGSPAPIKDPLIERGNALLALGDIASARLFYELALDNGNPQAATTIGQTYDPLYLKQLDVLGAPGKPEKALEWYRRGVEAGDMTAVERLKELTAWQAK